MTPTPPHPSPPSSERTPPRASAHPALSRRDFVQSGIAVVCGPSLLRCGSAPTGFIVGDPRLSARPGTPTGTPALGQSALGIGGSRDAVLYVPQDYDSAVPLPLFVALHGAGGSGSFWGSYQQRAEDRGMVLLAPDSRGRTWDAVLGAFGNDVAFLDLALARTFDLVRVDPQRIALGGFSDGASYALTLGVSNGDLFSHLVAYSPGFYLPGEDRLGRPPVFISHGDDDPILPTRLSRDDIVPRLRKQGYDVTYREFAGGHEVPAAVSEEALDWFTGAA